jgi:4-diphosphocytidyl-2-C-methyl-D-erythritol kinase
VRSPAPAKINLALVVGPLRDDGKHEVVTLYQRVGLHDRIDLARAPVTSVEGFDGDTIVRGALDALAEEAGVSAGWRVLIEKRIPVAAGLAGGSTDAATALRLANETLDEPLPQGALHDIGARLGADVPFFLREGVQLGTGDGTTLAPVDVPQDFWVLLVLANGATKQSTAAVYGAFDARDGARGFEERRAKLLDVLDGIRRPRDLASLPQNDLASSPLVEELEALGAFRADVSGAGPTVYGLFHHRTHAVAAARAFRRRAQTWITPPAWYG